MKACILAIGSEMLTPFRVDTNSLLITERLNAIGYDVRLKAVVADEVDELAEIIRAATRSTRRSTWTKRSRIGFAIASRAAG